jgi:pyruvate/2-oxoacid:ferredoxin oxidoreductase alpha subunit
LTRTGISSLSSRQTLGRTDCNARALTPKDFKHVRAALEHLVALEVLERERKAGRKAKWLYRKDARFNKRVVMVEKDEC